MMSIRIHLPDERLAGVAFLAFLAVALFAGVAFLAFLAVALFAGGGSLLYGSLLGGSLLHGAVFFGPSSLHSTSHVFKFALV